VNLLAVMYHRARAGSDGNSPLMLDAHFAYLARHCACVLPGEILAGDRLNVCLTFDDATSDFHSVVFPLLQKHGLRAVLAVSPGFICGQEDSFSAAQVKVGGEIRGAQMDRRLHCTWEELAVLVASGRVAIAAHGLSHVRLDRGDVDLQIEVLVPQRILSARLGQPVDSFVFPFGRFSPVALRTVKQHYRHAFRIGGAINRNWSGSVLYRVNGDGLTGPDSLFSAGRIAAARARFYWNRLRGR